MTQRFFFLKTQRIEPFFLTWLKDFSQKTSKNLTFLWLTDLNLYFSKKTTQRIDRFFFTMTLKMEFFLKYEYDLQNWFFFSIRLTELNLFFLRMTFLFSTLNFFFFLNTTQTKNRNSPIRLRGLNFIPFFVSLKELNFFFWIRLKELIF